MIEGRINPMKRTVRKVAALVFVMTLIVSICMPAFALKPSVKLVSRPTTAYRGYYMYHKYYLNSNSYSYRNGYRARFEGQYIRRATGKSYGGWGINWTGRGYQKIKTAVDWSCPRGAYRTYVRTFYRPSSYNRWTFVRSFNWYFNIR